MMQGPSLRSLVGDQVVDSRELDKAPRGLVHFGQAPDGLPWLCDVDRSSRIDHLYRTVTWLFDVPGVKDLPASVREATEGALAHGLLGIHAIALDARGPQPAFVTHRTARALFGPTILDQALASARWPTTQSNYAGQAIYTEQAVTATHAVGARADALESAIEDSRAARHVVLTLAGETWTASVSEADRALRVPTAPFRRATFESLAALPGATAKIQCGHDTWTAPLSDHAAYTDTLVRAGKSPYDAAVAYEVPRATVLRILSGVAAMLAERHRGGLVHGDVTPSNIILDGAQPTFGDALDIEVGHVAAAATFEWAAPEQVTARALDPRADVYALGQMACALVGAVPYGEQISYRVPTGGQSTRTVELIKTDGVFIDGTALDVSREWQTAWQDTLYRLVAYDRDERYADGAQAATALDQLAERFVPPGTVTIAGHFGAITPMPPTWPFARVIRDG